MSTYLQVSYRKAKKILADKERHLVECFINKIMTCPKVKWVIFVATIILYNKSPIGLT